MATIEAMNVRMAGLEHELQNARSAERTPLPESGPIAVTPTTTRSRPKMPDPEAYDGIEKSLYPPFISLLRAKLNVDRDALGSAYDRTWYAFGRLKGRAALQLLPWMDHFANNPKEVTEGTLTALLGQLDLIFKDKHQQENALRNLNQLKQLNQPFSDLLADFQRLLMEAGGYNWSDSVKKAALDNTLNREMDGQLTNVKKEETYDEYCLQLQSIADRMDRNRQKYASQSRGSQRNDTSRRGDLLNTYNNFSTNPPATPAPTAAMSQGDPMDWEHTTSTSRNRSRQTARWASNNEIAERKQQGLCIRCGGSGHFINKCPYNAPRRTNVARTQVAPKLEDSKGDERTIVEAQSEKEELL